MELEKDQRAEKQMEILEKSDSITADEQKTRIKLVVNGVESFVGFDLK